jgi:NAD kinase
MMDNSDKIVVITQPTPLEELVQRYNTRDQAKFYLHSQKVAYAPYQDAHDAYQAALAALKKAVPAGVRAQFVERSFLPNFQFGGRDLVVTLGRDGLVVNTAKYLDGQPLLAFNPDPGRIDGALARFPIAEAADALSMAWNQRLPAKSITMAKATLNDGQVLYAVNDLFIGQKSHLSARYRLHFGHQAEDQSSSGIIISTGAGSTGWFRSILAGAAGIVRGFTQNPELPDLRDNFAFDSAASYLYFSVREPFESRTSQANLIFGRLDEGTELVIESQMPQGGVIFSDGIEADHIEFPSGLVARVGVAEKKVNLLMPA